MNEAGNGAYPEHREIVARLPQAPNRPMEFAPERAQSGATMPERSLSRLREFTRSQDLKWILVTLSVATTSLLVLWLELLRSPVQ